MSASVAALTRLLLKSFVQTPTVFTHLEGGEGGGGSPSRGGEVSSSEQLTAPPDHHPSFD